MPSTVRKKGLFQLLWASAIFAASLAFVHWLHLKGWNHATWLFAIPGGFAIAGLLQFVTGISFSQLSTRWDALRPLQRGVLGTLIVLLSWTVIYVGVFSYIIFLA